MATRWEPSVASVEFACVDFVWRFTLGTPERILTSTSEPPVFLSKQFSFHVWAVVSSTDAMSP